MPLVLPPLAVHRGAPKVDLKKKVIERSDLQPGDSFSGPRLITEAYATTYLAKGWAAKVDKWGNLPFRKTE
jgi:N-methylhydantoinase A/oxoprolinase/acetone carboxylase beta subunit